LHLVQQFCMRRLKCGKLTDSGHQVIKKAHFAFGPVSIKTYCCNMKSD
jgi:hypothetical protein